MAKKARSHLGNAAPASASKKPKRVRRQCSAAGCDNRVVQGGVCVTHGAKRKLCSQPGCSKAVKLAGYCSTHGPARRKCDQDGCSRVAVQGGKCLSHGARRRVCSYPLTINGRGGQQEKCTKNAILGGMCKKHYDRMQDANGILEMSLCVPVAASSNASAVGNGNSGSADEDFSLGSSPSWTSSSTGAAVAVANAVAPAAVAPSAMALDPSKNSTTGHHRGGSRSHKQKKMKPLKGHERGLSIFDEMLTVDAIINSGAEKQSTHGGSEAAAAPQNPQRRPKTTRPQVACPMACPPLPQPSPLNVPSACDMAMSTKTPSAQVSFADCTSLPNKGPMATSCADDPEPCTGNASCACKACRSPTLAIFDQMIQASQKIESGEYDPAKYAGLSTPKLSPRKTVTRQPSALASGAQASTTPKNVSFFPEEPTSTGSVIRKVSNNNIVGEVWEGRATNKPPQHQRDDAANRAGIPLPQEYPRVPQEEGPASHALAAMAISSPDESGVSRTVSHDVDDGRYHHNHHPPSSYYPHYPQQPQQHHAPYPPPPQYTSHAPPHAHPPLPPQGYTRHSNYGSGGNYHHHHTTPHAFHPPQTPALYDNTAPMAVVSSHSTTTQHHEHQLLPRPRENMSHLFIPKEV